MAATDPWLTLGRGYDECLAKCAHPEYTLLAAGDETGHLGFVLLHPRGRHELSHVRAFRERVVAVLG